METIDKEQESDPAESVLNIQHNYSKQNILRKRFEQGDSLSYKLLKYMLNTYETNKVTK